MMIYETLTGLTADDTAQATVNDQVYSCGLNNYGQLGLGDAVDMNPQPLLQEVVALRGRRVVECAGGVHHSVSPPCCRSTLLMRACLLLAACYRRFILSLVFAFS